MGKNVVQKILDQHLVSGKAVPGEEVTIKMDQTLTQDATGTMAYLQLEVLNPDKLATEVSVSYVDHNTTQIGFENFDDHKYLQSIAKKYGIYFSRAGNGICHQVHLERFGVPGKTLIGSDSHTPTGGGIGMFAVGAGGLDVAMAMAKGTFTLKYPAVTNVILKGQLSSWVAAKDVILKLLSILSSKGNVGTVVEYSGEGIENLTVPQRATITNMGAELGVTTSVFPSDNQTKAFLKAQGNEDKWIELKADSDAVYEKTIEIDLAALEPMVAQPHNPDNVTLVKEVTDLAIDQVCIGSCTNSSYQDLMIAAEMLDNQQVNENVSFVIAPGSRQVLQMITENGALNKLIKAGGRLAESVCGFCIGNSQAPGTDSVSIRTSNRNFLGRSGTKSAMIYLTSVETAIASAIKGKLTDPRDLGLSWKDIPLPEKFLVDDSMIIAPAKENTSAKINRGPNIGQPPANTELPANIAGEVTIKVGDKITTDHIMPAGDKLKYRSNVPKYAEFVFNPVDETFSQRALANKEKNIHNIIIGGLSYGQGSSREHAALCPMYLGVKAVIAKSFERIHIANLINFGIVPLTFTNADDYEKIEQEDKVEMVGISDTLKGQGSLKLRNKTKNIEIPLSYQLSAQDVDYLLAGGKLNFYQ
ncbi:MAG: aconitate hydratase [Spirochaetes bacterium]|nr:aconitate hydratase [Spirochaetota bacterium]